MARFPDGVRIRRRSVLTEGFLAIALIFIVPSVYAQGGEFLSIDCGSTRASYNDSNNLQWVTDNGTYMKLGSTIQQPSEDQTPQSLQSFRYFSEGRSKYCYELPTTVGVSYLLRASFYMNGSLLNTTQFSQFQFTLAVDATIWFTVSNGVADQTSLTAVQEGIFNPSAEVMYVCLQPVVGIPFISSLELRAMVNGSLYSYDGSGIQYLALLFRYNLGATESSDPDVRYPDDIFDRIWTTPHASWDHCQHVSLPEAPDTSTSADALYVPPKVMKDAWLFQDGGCGTVAFPLYVTGPVYLTPAVSFYKAVYIEHLNKSDNETYTEFIFWDIKDPSDVEYVGDFSQTATVLQRKFQTLSTNNVTFQPEMGSGYRPLNDGPTMNAVEVYGQYNFNFSTTNSYDFAVIKALKTGFSLTDWQGDPCIPVPHNWLSCNLSKPLFGKLRQPCANSGNECSASSADLQTTYYVTSITLSHCTSSGFAVVIGINEPWSTLTSLNEMSITNSQVDNATFGFLIRYVSPVLSKMDLSYNSIDYIPPGSQWANLENLTYLNLAHNYLTGVSFEDVPPFNTLQNLNLSYNAMTSFPDTWTNTMESLVVLDLSHNQLQGNISSFDMLLQINNQSLQELDISNNNLSGIFPSDLYFLGLPNLQNANFDQNSIQGTLDLSGWFASLQRTLDGSSKDSSIPNSALQLFSFINNNIGDVVPNVDNYDSTIRQLIHTTNFSKKGILLGENPYCENPKSDIHQYLCRSSIDVPIKGPKKHSHKKLILIISLCGGVGGLILFSVIFTTLWKLWKEVYSLREIQRELLVRKVHPPFYQYSDLKLATKDFHRDNKLGHGAYGIVYKGILADETPLAVKKLFNSQRLQVLHEFLNEVVLISGIKHKNLIQLKGCCIKEKQRILVYEYAEKGNLADALWGSNACGELNWDQRFRICVGVAKGLSYLHEELQPTIIHRDIKPENILLDTDFNPKIADFGLARYILDDPSHARSTKNIAGTIGYFAPEYVMEGRLSNKIDVYSYGILILEVVSGRKCIDHSQPLEETFLRDWVSSMSRRDLLGDVLQPQLRDKCDMAEVMRAIHIGQLCVQQLPDERPTMSQVVTMLVGSMEITLPDESHCTDTSFNKLLTTIDRNTQYSTLEIIEEDSSIFPLLDSTSIGSSSLKLPQIELRTLYGP